MNPFIKSIEREFIHVDTWVPNENELILKSAKDVLVAPVCEFYGVNIQGLDFFRLSPKRSYNNQKFRDHLTHYLNYFLKFYDPDRELLSIYAKIKYLIDYQDGYSKEALFYDITKYILKSTSMELKVHFMNKDNYILMKKHRTKELNLQYTDKHAFIMMKISMLMKLSIPVLTHFAYINKIKNINIFLLEIYDLIINLFDINLISKYYETTTSIVNNSVRSNPLWERQDIRGISPTTHALTSIENIILSLMPKYEYSGSGIFLNYKSINDNTRHQVLNIEYDYDYIEHSSSKRDLENNSEFDRFESHLVKQDEALFIYYTVNCEQTMERLTLQYGDFSEEEVKFFTKRLLNDSNEFIINSFQKELIFNLFYKYFGDPISIKAINRDQWVKLMMLSRKILQANNMVFLPYIISSKVSRLVSRNSINKKESNKLQASPFFDMIKNKYKNEKQVKNILSIIATIISSEFEMIDFYDSEIDGKIIKPMEDIICEEILMYISLI